MSDVYTMVTERITAALEQGTVPWRKPWATAGPPRNLISRKPYRGMNLLLLSLDQPYHSPWWVTFKQAQSRGGTVRKAARGSLVTFWKFPDRDQVEASGEEEPSRPDRRAPILRLYWVFNVEQCEGIAEPPDAGEMRHDHQPLEACEQLVAGMPQRPPILAHPSGACYSPARDRVSMPELSRFVNAEAYYGTLFHELVHATGHPTRLNRPTVAEPSPFGTPDYSREELVAELGAAFLCGHAGILPATLENTAAYIRGWLRVLRDDRRLLPIAASQAQRAADFILGSGEEVAKD